MIQSKVLGSTLIIAGTAIGAGMLALPIASSGLGFVTSVLIMVGMWALMGYTALLLLELHQHVDYDATLHTLAKQFLGDTGKWVATFAMLWLFYALCAAYITGGGEQFNHKLSDWFSLELSQSVATVIFTIIIASLVTLGTQSVDRVNKILFIGKLVAMAVVLFLLTPNIKPSNLVHMPVEQGLIFASLPVMFVSFGFHVSIPVVVRYLSLDVRSLRKVLLIGSSLPLVLYILWQLSTLGVVEQAAMNQVHGVSELIATLSFTIQSELVSDMVSIFSSLALITSFLGVSLGLFEFLGDSLNKNQTLKGRIAVALVTFLPPLGFALFYPKGFVMALGYASIALVVLAVYLPIAMILASRKQHKNQSYTVIGGNLGLILVFIAGGLILISQILISVGVLPNIG